MAEGQSPYQFAGTDEQRQLIERAIPQKAPAAPKRPRKLLVVTLQVRDGQVRSRGHAAITYGNLAMELMGRKTGAFEAVFNNEMSVFRPENLKAFDAICFNNTVGKQPPWEWSQQGKPPTDLLCLRLNACRAGTLKLEVKYNSPIGRFELLGWIFLRSVPI